MSSIYKRDTVNVDYFKLQKRGEIMEGAKGINERQPVELRVLVLHKIFLLQVGNSVYGGESYIINIKAS